MSQNNGNIYQIARQSAGFTQERAAELIGTSIESLRAYEGDGRIPPGKLVLKMIEVYNTQFLAYQHMKLNEDVGSKFLPVIEMKDLPSAVLVLQKEVNDYLKKQDKLVNIGCDGKITKDELTEWQSIIKELDDIMKAIYTLKFVNKQG